MIRLLKDVFVEEGILMNKTNEFFAVFCYAKVVFIKWDYYANIFQIMQNRQI
jgi:hypothetical protein